jgi:hypothetical protein
MLYQTRGPILSDAHSVLDGPLKKLCYELILTLRVAQQIDHSLRFVVIIVP